MLNSKIKFNINIHPGYEVKIKFLYIFKCFDHLGDVLFIKYLVYIYQTSGFSVIHIISYRLLLYCPAYENASINIFIIIRLFIVIKYYPKNTLTSMQKSNKNQIIQGKATLKEDINEQLIRSEEIRATLDKNVWSISN
jgi:hypothetical protein